MSMNKGPRALKTHRSGLTLVEILVGLGVLALLVAVAVPSMADLLERRRVIAAAEEVAGILTYAKAETNATSSVLIARFDPDPSAKMSCAAVVTAAGLNKCRCYFPAGDICPGTTSRSLRLFQLPQDYVKFSAAATSWAGGANQVRFTREQMGVDTQGFHVDIVGLKKGYALRVDLNTAGRVRTCSPAGDMTGFAKCA
ncbi:MAG: hypothetical protein GXC94_09955 [Comamonadaceae bacterium]|nr:hypothetical protein [Comamonadaceae bacterium]